MQQPTNPEDSMHSKEVVAALRGALATALENLPDVAADSGFGARATAECCADIAALNQLLSPPYEQANVPGSQQVPAIMAYL